MSWTQSHVVCFDTCPTVAGTTNGGAGLLRIVSANGNLSIPSGELIQRVKSCHGGHKEHHQCSSCPRSRPHPFQLLRSLKPLKLPNATHSIRVNMVKKTEPGTVIVNTVEFSRTRDSVSSSSCLTPHHLIVRRWSRASLLVDAAMHLDSHVPVPSRVKHDDYGLHLSARQSCPQYLSQLQHTIMSTQRH